MQKTTSSRLSELMTIRDILMGEIIEEYNDRFEALEKDLAAQKEALEQKERQLDDRISALDELLKGNTQQLHKEIADKTKEDRTALGALFLSLGQQLKEK